MVTTYNKVITIIIELCTFTASSIESYLSVLHKHSSWIHSFNSFSFSSSLSVEYDSMDSLKNKLRQDVISMNHRKSGVKLLGKYERNSVDRGWYMFILLTYYVLS